MQKKSKLNRTERMEIEILLGKGYSLRQIAGVLERSPNTISYEIFINGGKERYNAKNAHQYARTRKKDTRREWAKIEADKSLKNFIIGGLMQYWNPDEISGYMKETKTSFYASKTAIYDWLRSAHGQPYCRYLYSKRYYKKKRKKGKERMVIPNRIPIQNRPLGATNRSRYRHWESDAIVSKKGTLGGIQTNIERKSRLIALYKRNSMSPKETVLIIKKMKLDYEINTVTYDNGFENRHHAETHINSYFCDPYSSWQKGGVENANKLIRRFLPKGTNMEYVSQEMLDRVSYIINNKPRKILGYKKALDAARDNGIIKNKSVLIEG